MSDTPSYKAASSPGFPTPRPYVGFVVWPQKGHIYPTLPLARMLTSRGVDICYFGPRLAQAIIEEQGFRFAEVGPNPVDPAFQRMSLTERSNAIAALIPDFVEQIKAAKITELFVDPLVYAGTVAGLMAGVKVWYFWVMNPCYRRGRHRAFIYSTGRIVLPLMRHLPGALWLPQKLFWWWWRLRESKRDSLYTLAKEVGERHGYEMCLTSYGYRANLPTIVFGPERFEHWRDEQLVHLGLGVDTDRREHALDLVIDKELVYVSFGINYDRYPGAADVLRHVCEAAKRFPGLHFVIQVSADSSSFPTADNLTLVTTAPALTLLDQAKVAITHGGFGAIKECIVAAVPMLVIPFYYDQPANGVKVESEGLGIVLGSRSVTAESIAQALEQLLDEPAYGQRLQAFRNRCEADDRYQEFCDHLVGVDHLSSRN